MAHLAHPSKLVLPLMYTLIYGMPCFTCAKLCACVAEVEGTNDHNFMKIPLELIFQTISLPYKNKYWRATKFDKLANCHAITKFKFRQYFFYSVSIVTLVAFE